MQNKKGVAHTRQINVTSSTAFTGPLPHPDILERYAHVSPALLDKIVQAADSERGHRHAMDIKMTELAKDEIEMPNIIHKRDFVDKQLSRLFVVSVMGLIFGATAHFGIQMKDEKAWFILAGEFIAFAYIGARAQDKARDKK